MTVPPTPEQQPVIVSLRDVAKHYALSQGSRQKMAALIAAFRGQPSRFRYEALNGVNLEVRRGESLGLVGMNGAGKSTLLKMIAGVVRPTAGQIAVNGRLSALLELGAGFHPDYTGRDNVFLACALMGMGRAETQAKLDDILAFADIGAHIDQPIKHYSSGMVVRLGFAVATASRPDLLITDEVLAVGDESFQRKCVRWMTRYLDDGGTLLLCSHSMYHIQKLCARAAWIHQGSVYQQGPANEVVAAYLAWHDQKSGGADGVAAAFDVVSDPTVYHVARMALNGHEDMQLRLPMGADLRVEGEVFSPDDRPPKVASSIVRPDGSPVFGVYSDIDEYHAHRLGPNRYAFALQYTQLPLLPGEYTVRTHAMDPEGMRLFDQMTRGLTITGGTRYEGVCLLTHHWTHPNPF